MIYWANLKALIKFAFFMKWLTDINKFLTPPCSTVILTVSHWNGHTCQALEVTLTKVRGTLTLSALLVAMIWWVSIWCPNNKECYVFLCSLSGTLLAPAFSFSPSAHASWDLSVPWEVSWHWRWIMGFADRLELKSWSNYLLTMGHWASYLISLLFFPSSVKCF